MAKEGLKNNLPKEYDATATQELLEDVTERIMGNNNVPVGTVLSFAGSTSPNGYLICDGSAIKRNSYKDLFSIIGTTYGTGDGSTTFNLPDMRGVFLKGAGTTNRVAGKDANGNYYAGTLGAYSQDKMQGHHHDIGDPNAAIIYRTSAAGSLGLPDNTAANSGNRMKAGTQITDGTNGAPRIGITTEPQSLGLNFIIKY